MAKHRHPYYSMQGATHADIYFFIKHKQVEVNPFDKITIQEYRQIILNDARTMAPSYKMFISAATKATGLSKTSINSYLK